MKNSGSFHISAQNIDYGYLLELPWWGSSNEYPQSMFLNRNKKITVYPCKPQFYYIKVGFKGVKTIQACFGDAWANSTSSGILTWTSWSEVRSEVKHYENRPIQVYWHFYHQKKKKSFRWKILVVFIFLLKI